MKPTVIIDLDKPEYQHWSRVCIIDLVYMVSPRVSEQSVVESHVHIIKVFLMYSSISLVAVISQVLK